MPAKPLLTYFAKERSDSELPEFQMRYNYKRDYNEIIFLDDKKASGQIIEVYSDVTNAANKTTMDSLTLLMATQTFTKSIGEPRDSDF